MTVLGGNQLSVLTEAPRVHLYINSTLASTGVTNPLEAVLFPNKIPPYETSNVTIACVGKDGQPTMPPQRVCVRESLCFV